jgi:hypothetical protein
MADAALHKDVLKRVAVSALGLFVTVPLSYFLKRALESWGVLDSVADTFGGWLKVHVPPETAGWTVSVALAALLYCLLLWRVWHVRHVHHLPINATVGVHPSVDVQFIPARDPDGIYHFDQLVGRAAGVHVDLQTSTITFDEITDTSNLDRSRPVTYRNYTLEITGIQRSIGQRTIATSTGSRSDNAVITGVTAHITAMKA